MNKQKQSTQTQQKVNTTTEREERINTYWEKNKTFEQSVEQRSKEKQFVFYDGPPFATGTPHYGHLLGSTSKDVFGRFWTMRGFRVPRVWGWDCHGLPIENLVEKNLGFKKKKEIEELGVKEFNDHCRSTVLSFTEEWKKVIRRLGRWVDMEHSYHTMDNSFMESVWWALKQLHEKGLLYEGKKILLYCPHCETPLAKSEIAMDKSYKDVTEKTVFVKFKLLDEDAHLLVWTTTPWTLIGNVTMAVNSSLDYVKVKTGTDTLYLAEGALGVLKDQYEVLEKVKGKDLVSKKYEPLYDIGQDKKSHVIVDGGSEIVADEGSGIVHMASYGELDYAIAKEKGFAPLTHISHDGKLEKGPKEWLGTWFKKVDPLVMKDLEERHLLYKILDHAHSYPHCYRCDTPLFYNPMDSWFMNIQKIKLRLLETAKKIHFHPENISRMFQYNIENAPDWTLSRNRYWATALPIWKSPSGEVKVVGSVKELQELAVEDVSDDVSLHKDVMDTIHLKSSSGETMTRIPEVLDCWFESGSMTFAQYHYPFEHEEFFKQVFPAGFVSEYIAQARTWFYYMHVLSVALFDKAPFEHVKVTGNILASDGSKMSKSKKNFTDPVLLLDQFGADALRFYLMNSQLTKAQDLSFSDDGVKEVHRKVIGLLDNVRKFYGLFSRGVPLSPDATNVLDRWMISRVHEVVRENTAAMEEYDTVTSCANVLSLVDDLSTWYVRRSRDRFKSKDESVKKEAVQTLGYVLDLLARTLAPLAPFIAEDVYLSVHGEGKKTSVHLQEWPLAEEARIDDELMKSMALAREVVTLALNAREEHKVPVKQPLSMLTVRGISLEKDLLDVIASEVNVKKVVLEKGPELSVVLDTQLTPALEQEGAARELVRHGNQLRKELKLTLKDRIDLVVESDDAIVKGAVTSFNQLLQDALHADSVALGSVSGEGKEVKVKGHSVRMSAVRK